MADQGGRRPRRLRLRRYQRTAVDVVDARQERALIVAACGTGKTLMAVHTVAKLLDGRPGAVLVTFPTLGLLEQTYRTWQQQAPFDFAALGVCSAHLRDTEDIHSDELSIASTTSPQQVAAWRAGLTGVGVAFCTYQSLAVITAAHAEHGMEPWSVAVFDEAHRTAGLQGKPFAAALDSNKIPSQHRLFYTATPKVHSGPRTRAGKPRRRTVASMDDPDLYGPQVFTLPARDAIEQGILSPFKVAVIAVSDSAVAAALKDLRLVSLAAGDEGAARADHVAAAIALTQAAADYQLSSVLAFHNTIAASAEFATTFARVHALLSAQGLNPDGRAAAIRHIDGTTTLRDRLAATQTLAVPGADQWNVVTNARCLTEGINIPALDAVFFAEPRASEVDVAQAVGRAIRKNPHHDRPALIVLAVTVDDSQDAETVIDVSEFRRTRQVLKALQSHDPSVSRDLAAVREQLTDPDLGEQENVKSDILDIHVPTTLSRRMVKQFFQAFSIHTVDAMTRQWEENYSSLKRFANQHGHCNISKTDKSQTCSALGTWIQHQRGLYTRGRLLAERIERLEALPGWSWNALDARWEQNFAALQQFAAEHGHPFPPFSYRSAEGYRPAAWISNQRRTLGKDPVSMKRRARLETLPGWTWSRPDTRWEEAFNKLAEHLERTGELRVRPRTTLANWINRQRLLYRRGDLDAMRARRLAALPGWTWSPLDTGWDDNFGTLSDYVARTGRARPPQSYTTDAGFQLGRWVSDQRRRRAALSQERRAQLEALPGWTWDPREAQWEDFITALRAFAAEHGHAYPPREPTRPELVKLNQAVVSVRRPARRDRLSAQQRRQLEELPGWSWEYRQKSTWENSFAALVAYAAQHGHAAPPKDYCTPDGLALGLWVNDMRRPSRRRKLSARRAARLEALPGWTW
ncbi:Helicase associated domain protein [Mycobacterium avium subsp. hominissuis]|uniref:DEAD/DEAH box helicase n=1 Tax=Mycobacterium avium TaxID=1764 RepID=UPI0026654DCB|nr:DEAD/DEAH box helicase [Mycobacterium avium]MDO2394681.1 Helicase associated domain protein [Mycobacterium avium subsp. hominissuis]